MFKYIAPPVPRNSSPRRGSQSSAGGFTEEDDQENCHVSEIPQSSTQVARTSDDRRPDSPIVDSSHATAQRRVGNYPNLSRVADAQPYFSETRQSMLARRLRLKTRIQPFDGNPMNWPLFSNDFQTSVHNVLEHDSDRLTILKELLTPSVRQTIARFIFSLSLYSKAWETFERNYGSNYRSSTCCH